MRALVLIATVTALAAAPVFALNRGEFLRVVQDSPTDFTVAFHGQARLTDYWCAAGNFVTNTMALPDRTRVYRLSPPPRKAGQGISFTLDASRSAGTTGLSTFGGPQDGSMSAGGAVSQFCSVFEFE